MAEGQATILDISFATPAIGYAADAQGRVWKTQDGGHNWAPILSEVGTEHWVGIHAASPSQVIVTGYIDVTQQQQQGVYRFSGDGGATWSAEMLLNPAVPLGRVRSIGLSEGLIVDNGSDGDPTPVHFTSDGGLSPQDWTNSNPRGPGFFGAEFSLLPDGRAAATGSSYCASEDAGASWNCGPPIDSVTDTGVFFVDDYNGWTGGSVISPYTAGWIHRTTDGGHTWSARTFNSSTMPIFEIYFITPSLGWAMGWIPGAGSPLLFSQDGGQTWTPQLESPYQLDACDSKPITGGFQVWCAGYSAQNPVDGDSAIYTTTVLLAPTTTTLTASPSTVSNGGNVLLTANVSSSGPAPGGPVYFYVGTYQLGFASPDANGNASITASTANVPDDIYEVTAQYDGDINTAPSKAAQAVQVTN